MVHRGGRRGEQETVERERGKATLYVPAHNNRKGTLRAPGRDGLVRQASAGVIVYNEGNMKKNILIGHPTLGSKGVCIAHRLLRGAYNPLFPLFLQC